MRIITYFGKGGTGKTTLAAATALAAAERGTKTLVLSATAGHGLGDALGVRLGHDPKEVAPNLFAREVSALAEIRGQWPVLQDYVATFLRGIGSGKAYVQEIVLIPAIEEMVALTEIWRTATSGDYEAIIIDAPPTSGAMTLLAGPDGLRWILSSIDIWYRKLSLLATPVMQTLFPSRNPMDMLPEIARRVTELREILINPDVSAHRLVTVPETLALADSFRIVNYHHLYECPVDAAFVNRVIAGSARQAAALERTRGGASGIPHFEIAELAADPVGLPALTDLGKTIFKDADPLAPLSPPQKLRELIDAGDGKFLLKLKLPNLELDTLDLVTRGGELILELGTFKRNIPLPADVRSKEAVGADYEDGVLTITFE